MIKHYSIAATFGITAPVSMQVEGFEPAQNVYVPTQKPYVFRKDHLRDVLAFLGSPNGDGLYLTGPTGSGKTSLLEQVAARLHWGVHAVTATAGWSLTICSVSTCWSMAAPCTG